MKHHALLCLLTFGIGCVLAGCNTGTVSEDQQEVKVKAMNDIAKKDPDYATKRAHAAGRG